MMNGSIASDYRSCTRICAITLCLLLGAAPATARQTNVSLASGRQPVRGSVTAVYQSYDDDGFKASELSIPISISAPLGSNITMSLHAAQMSVSGDLVKLSGISDTQVILSYARRAGNGSFVFSLGASLPTGKSDLTQEEFTTVILISQRAFDFRVPSLGQGFGIAPSLTYAVPVGAGTALGLGASYQVRGAYKPFDTLTEDYTPGNEILLTGGVDTRIDARSALSFDVSHSIYAADQLGGVEVYEAGGKTTISAMYRNVVGFNEFRLVGTYRTRAKSSELSGGELVTAGSRTLPNQFNLLASYRKRVQEDFEVTALAEGRMFDKTSLYEKRSMVDLGLVPSYRLSPEATLVGRFVYTLGTITGLEAGAGVSVAF